MSFYPGASLALAYHNVNLVPGIPAPKSAIQRSPRRLAIPQLGRIGITYRAVNPRGPETFQSRRRLQSTPRGLVRKTLHQSPPHPTIDSCHAYRPQQTID